MCDGILHFSVKTTLESQEVQRLNRSQFQTYLDLLTEGMPLEECAEFFEFLITSVKVSGCGQQGSGCGQ